MSGDFRVERGAGVGSGQARPCGVRDVASGADVTVQRPAPLRLDGPGAAGALAAHPLLGALGPEPLSAEFDAAALARACHRKKVAIKVALLDQRVVAGLGNIYASEALHVAGLSPKRRAATLATRAGQPTPAARAARRRDREGAGARDRSAGVTLPRLRARRRALPAARLRRDDQAHRAGGTLDVLLSEVSALSRRVASGAMPSC